MLAVKLVVCWQTHGTADIDSWIRYAEYVSTKDVFSVYENIALYNHPPLMSFWLKFLVWLTQGNPDLFPQFFRMAPIAADFGSAIVVWKACQTYFSERGAFLRTMLAVTSPILVMVSGFHGNTDPIFGFLILLAGYLLAVRRKLILSALVLALAINIKIVPLLATPAFFFWIRNNRQRVQFTLWFTGAASLGYLVHFFTVPEHIFKNIFLYTSIPDMWGFGLALRSFNVYHGLGLVLMGMSILFFSWHIGRQNSPDSTIEEMPVGNGLNLFRAVALVFVSFMALTSGFGVQYLSWIASLIVFLQFEIAVLFTYSASAFLFMVYTSWYRGYWWKFINVWVPGPWPPDAVLAGYFAWLCSLLLLVLNVQWPRPSPAPAVPEIAAALPETAE